MAEDEPGVTQDNMIRSRADPDWSTRGRSEKPQERRAKVARTKVPSDLVAAGLEM